MILKLINIVIKITYNQYTEQCGASDDAYTDKCIMNKYYITL